MTPRFNKPVLAGVLGLAVYAVLAAAAGHSWSAATVLNTALYLLLLLNTYFSVSFTESALRMRCRSDAAISAVLLVLYLALPCTVHDPGRFYLLMALFFSLAVVKYANWLGRVEGDFFLRRKIIANSCGAAGGILAVGVLILFDRPLWVTVLAVAAYAYGSLHTLVLDPLYRLR